MWQYFQFVTQVVVVLTQVKVATEKMMRGTLEHALAVQQEDPSTVTSAANVPRIMFISGSLNTHHRIALYLAVTLYSWVV